MNIIPQVINPIEMGSLCQGKINLKNAASILVRKYVNRRGLSKEVLWVSISQRTAKLQAVKFGDLKKFCRSVRVKPLKGILGLSP